MYGLIVWLNAETVDTLVTDYRQLLSDLANVDADMDKSTDELVGEVKSRLFRSNVPWLLVFDNIDDHHLLDQFVPRGAGAKGHVLVTSRHRDSEAAAADAPASEGGGLVLGCLSTRDAVELLRRSAGGHNMAGPANAAAAADLSERLGKLPLALSMAAAYMRQCDVRCAEYLERYAASERNARTFLRGVASSLSLIVPKIEEENRTAAEVLHLLSFLGPELITKPLLRHLLLAKKAADRSITERSGAIATTTKNCMSSRMSLIFCGLVLGGTTFLSGTRPHRAVTLAAFSVAATSVLLFPWIITKDSLPEEAITRTMERTESFSAFEYEQADLAWDVLKSFSLLSVKEGKGSVHRLLQQAMLSHTSEQERLYYLAICIDSLSSIWAFKPDDLNSWKDSLQVLEHVKVVAAHSRTCHFDAKYTLKVSALAKGAGVFSAMVLNAFVEANVSLNVSLTLLENSDFANTVHFQKARAETLYELSKVHRYQGQYDDAHKCLLSSLELNDCDDCLTADVQHELGVLEVKKHNLESATSILQQSLKIRRSLDNTGISQAKASSTLHQLAAIHVAHKPPSLRKAKALLQEALSLSHQIGQRAATLKQLARVTIREGSVDQAESYLSQALELYLELYGDNKLHINVAAVKVNSYLVISLFRKLDYLNCSIWCLLVSARGPCCAA